MKTIDADPDPDSDADDTESGHISTLPWWRNPLNFVAIALVIAALAGTLGFVLGRNSATLKADTVDVGFLQDMRAHHNQAVEMSLTFIAKPDVSPSLKVLAAEIIVSQQGEMGRMGEMLRTMGEPEYPPTDIVMAWMNEPVDIDRMPGLASDADMDALVAASGAEADQLFVDLMVAHHEGGIHMAESAEATATNEEVRTLASTMGQVQINEITELKTWLARTQQ